jgi:hypothetical protein
MEEANPDPVDLEIWNPEGAKIVTLSFAGTKFKPANVNVCSLEIVFTTTLPIESELGELLIAGAALESPFPLTDIFVEAPPPLFVTFPL